MSENKTIAFFDFDGTITNKDIFGDFIAYRLKHGLPYSKLLKCLPIMLLYKLRLLKNHQAKEIIFTHLFKNESVAQFEQHVVNYTANRLPQLLKKDALEKLKWHQQQGHTVYLVSANFDLILNEFAKQYNLPHLSTTLAIAGNTITGKFATPNCYGAEKVTRIRSLLPDLDTYTNIYAYGDSRGDKEMLGISNNPHYRHFKG